MAGPWYVDNTAGGTFSGLSWTNAAQNTQQLLGQACSLGFGTATTILTLAANNGLGWVTTGMTVFDVTSATTVGTVSSIAGTVLTLQANALHTSSGAADVLAFGGPTGVVVAGDTIYIRNTSVETYATALTFAFPGTQANPNYIYSTTNAGPPPTSANLSAGTHTTSGYLDQINTSAGNGIIITGSYYCYGVNFKAGSGANSAGFSLQASGAQSNLFDNCTFNMGDSAGAGGNLSFGANAYEFVQCILNNCRVGLCPGTLFLLGTDFTWKNSTAALSFTGSQSTRLFYCNAGVNAFIEGVDLSAYSNNTTGVLIFDGSTGPNRVWLKDCKLNAAYAPLVAGSFSITRSGSHFYVSRSDSSGTVNEFACTDVSGFEVNTTSINRVGGAADFAGTGFSKKIATNANSNFSAPFVALPLSAVSTNPGAHTITIYGIIDSASLPTNKDLWIEVEYPADSGDPLGGFVSSAASSGTSIMPSAIWAGSPYTSDGTSTWNKPGFGTAGSPFTMTATFTTNLKGPITVRVLAATASTTWYIDAQAYLS